MLENKINASATAWQKELQHAFRRVDDLLDFLSIREQSNILKTELSSFPTLVTKSFAQRMKVGDPNDPLLLQVLPLSDENKTVSGFVADPVGDLLAEKTNGIIHKYHGRVLLISTGACAIHCRYCFRREFPYAQHQNSNRHFDQALFYIKQHPEIEEVIFSGGDPLMLSDEKLHHQLLKLNTLNQIKRIRFHTRIPVVLPSRISPEFLKVLNSTSAQIIMVIHANHPNEISDEVKHVLKQLHACDISLFNQTVLLKSINDNATILAELSRVLFDQRVTPYYLHTLDKVTGTSHFDVPLSTARSLFQQLQTQLPGYLVPKLAHEEQGKPCKTLII